MQGRRDRASGIVPSPDHNSRQCRSPAGAALQPFSTKLGVKSRMRPPISDSLCTLHSGRMDIIAPLGEHIFRFHSALAAAAAHCGARGAIMRGACGTVARGASWCGPTVHITRSSHPCTHTRTHRQTHRRRGDRVSHCRRTDHRCTGTHLHIRRGGTAACRGAARRAACRRRRAYSPSRTAAKLMNMQRVTVGRPA